MKFYMIYSTQSEPKQLKKGASLNKIVLKYGLLFIVKF